MDDAYCEGMEIPIYYDPLIAKLIVFGKDRKEAIERMIRAIDDYRITGVNTTLGFCRFVMQHEAFVSGKFDTHFVKNHFKPEYLLSNNKDEMELAAILAVRMLRQRSVPLKNFSQSETKSNWKSNRLK